MALKDRTPVVVGMGVVSPAGNSVDEFAEHVFDGKVGNIRQITRFDASAFEIRIAGEVPMNVNGGVGGLDYLVKVVTEKQVPSELVSSLKKAWRSMGDYTRYAILAGVQAVEQAGRKLN